MAIELSLQAGDVKKLIKSGIKMPEEVVSDLQYKADDRFTVLECGKFSEANLNRIREFLEKNTSPDARKAIWKLDNYLNLLSKDVREVKITNLQALEEALIKYIKPSEHRWFFDEDGDPHWVGNIEYHPPEEDNPAFVEVNMHYMMQGRKQGSSIHFRGSVNNTVVALLRAKGYYLETPEAVKTYEGYMKLLKEYSPQTGRQFAALGEGAISEGYSGRNISMVRDGRPTKVVMDDLVTEDNDGEGKIRTEESAWTNNSFWETGKRSRRSRGYRDDDDDEREVAPILLPEHPYVDVFDLEKHSFVTMHVRNIQPYEYDHALGEKLILPKEKKELVNILIQGANSLMDDIIKGKTGGIIVLATGLPGTGKTLTAEVYSEAIGKPLYVVQCSQLGTNEEKLEKNLKRVLNRASRWGAILLIDEADVYIHERGTNMVQNAIVGVFLRVLEYYRGILFLTSNRETVIDDAIVSRATAHIRYNLPTRDELKGIWKVLGRQFKIAEVEDTAFLGGVALELPNISGRNVKNLLKLAKLLANKEERKVDVALIKHVSKFLDLSEQEDK